ncbi:MAG: PaaI family thioesterase [Desulfuromonadales bacterium]|nr:PaaI family thioesterase [Desulfuromonadales bacterium]
MKNEGLTGVEADGHCFVCGRLNERGLHAIFAIDRDRRRSSCRIALPDGFQGWADVVHGGILSTLLDEACIYACRSVGDQFVTAELTVKFRKPVLLGDELEIAGELLEQRKRICNARARILVDGVVHAEATAKIFALDDRG